MATLAETSLSPIQRAVLELFVEHLRERLGDDLVAVWLYGSHARGEGVPVDSDVDVMVIARGLDSSDPLHEATSAANDAVDAFSGIAARAYSPEKLAERRQIEAFYVKEIDRDKVVLYGDAQGGAPELPGLSVNGMRPWSKARTHSGTRLATASRSHSRRPRRRSPPPPPSSPRSRPRYLPPSSLPARCSRSKA